jgi:hypothetical protein
MKFKNVLNNIEKSKFGFFNLDSVPLNKDIVRKNIPYRFICKTRDFNGVLLINTLINKNIEISYIGGGYPTWYCTKEPIYLDTYHGHVFDNEVKIDFNRNHFYLFLK